MNRSLYVFAGFCLLLFAAGGLAQDHSHHHDHEAEPVEPPPRIFLDKSPRIVQFQLDRLSNERLLMVERSTDVPKYGPVYEAILARPGMTRQHRDEALQALATIRQSDVVAELLAALGRLDSDDRSARSVARQLTAILVQQPADRLEQHVDELESAIGAESDALRTAGFAGLIVAGRSERARELASENLLDYLAAIPLLPKRHLTPTLRESVVRALDASHPLAVRRAALTTLAAIPLEQADNFRLAAALVDDPRLQNAAVSTLLKIPRRFYDQPTALALVDQLVAQAEATPVKDRTSDEFTDSMLLVDQLMAVIPVAEARAYRQRLREITVRLVRIHTVEEEMRYDTPFFAVEAGRPVQVILTNEDLMPHNIVFTVPGALQEVAELGAEVGPEGGLDGKQYVPDSPKVLHATDMVPARQETRLTFTAPSEPGEYPYVCTFPRHWMRMYGVMVVVLDLDAWLKNPIEPVDPVGSNRSFVQAWTVEDLQDELDTGLRGRSPEIGHKIFTEATCAQCHKLHGEGGAVGPELNDVFTRWKGDRVGVLREILDPSHKIDPQYTVRIVVTDEGLVISGIVKAEDDKSVSILANPEAPEPTVIPKDEIEEMITTSQSMMPKALLDRFTKDEIFELLALLESAAADSPTATVTTPKDSHE